MEAAVEGDDALAFGVVARQLHGGLDGFSTGVAVEDANGAGHGRDLLQTLGQGDHVFVIEVGARHVDQLGGLLLNGGHHLRMAVSGGGHGDAGGEVQKLVAIDVFDDHAASAFHDQRIGAGVRRRNILLIPIKNLLRIGAGQFGADFRTGGRHCLSSHGNPLHSIRSGA